MKKIGILSPENSWTRLHCLQLKKELEARGYFVSYADSPKKLEEPLDVVCILSYPRIVSADFLNKHEHNLVAHSSALPSGRGWSPLNWQILEGKNDIPVTLFEAEEELDSGVIYLQKYLKLEGHELLSEILDMEGKLINEMIIEFLEDYDRVLKNAREQKGEATFYERRRPKDSRLDPYKTIADQFNLLRAVDNERYPAFFEYKGHKYILKIYKDESDE